MSVEAELDFDLGPVEPVVHNEADIYVLGRCRSGGALLDLFFSANAQDIARAQAICARCVVRAACLEGAIRREEPWGVWGGEYFDGGIVAQHRPSGRKPKVPKPIKVDERFV